MLLRRPNIDDIPEIEDIAKKYENNPLPESFTDAVVVEANNDVKAFGVITNHLEALLYCDGNDKEKVLALKLIVEQLKSDALSQGKQYHIDKVYVYAQNEEFAQILVKHFGFRRANGVPLIMDL